MVCHLILEFQSYDKLFFQLKGCQYKGKVYKIRDEVPVDNPCQKGCYCAEGFGNESRPEIRCAAVDCFNNFKAPTPNCFIVYDDDECCGREKCLTEGQIKHEHKCLYDGREYRLGERIYPKEDPCLSCVCTENWDQNKPTKSTNCKKVECDVHTNSNFKAGCLPIYHEKACCPIDYFCRKSNQ